MDLTAHVRATRVDRVEHALAVANLPPLHRDPFDRLLVAQARGAGLTLVTADNDIARYDVAQVNARS